MTPDETRELVREALRSRTLGQAMIALKAVLGCELCPPGTLAKLELLTATEPVDPDEGFAGKFVDSLFDGFCQDCGTPYAMGESVFWQGKGKGALCRGCRVADAVVKKR